MDIPRHFYSIKKKKTETLPDGAKCKETREILAGHNIYILRRRMVRIIIFDDVVCNKRPSHNQNNKAVREELGICYTFLQSPELSTCVK